MARVGAGESVPDTLPPGGGVVGVVTLTCWWAQADVRSKAAAMESRRIGSEEKDAGKRQCGLGYARRGQWLR